MKCILLQLIFIGLICAAKRRGKGRASRSIALKTQINTALIDDALIMTKGYKAETVIPLLHESYINVASDRTPIQKTLRAMAYYHDRCMKHGNSIRFNPNIEGRLQECSLHTTIDLWQNKEVRELMAALPAMDPIFDWDEFAANLQDEKYRNLVEDYLTTGDKQTLSYILKPETIPEPENDMIEKPTSTSDEDEKSSEEEITEGIEEPNSTAEPVMNDTELQIGDPSKKKPETQKKGPKSSAGRCSLTLSLVISILATIALYL